MSKTITHEDWLTALLAAQAKNDKGWSSQEWARHMGVSVKTALERIRLASRKGWVVVGKRSITSLDGRQTYAPVYTIKEPRK